MTVAAPVSPGRRTASLVILVVAIAFSLAALLVPGFDVVYRGEGLHTAVNAIEATLFLVVGGVAWSRYTRTRLAIDLAVALAFGIVLTVQGAFLLALPTLLNYQQLRPFSAWASIVTSTLAPLLLVAGARGEAVWERRAAAATMFVLAIVGVSALVILRFESRFHLPVDPTLSPADAARVAFRGAGTIHVLEVVAAVALFAAAACLLRRRTDQPLHGWLPPALLVAAVGSLDYAVYPSLYSYWIYVGDELWLACCVLLAWGVIAELRVASRRAIEVAVLEERRRLARDLHDGVAQELAFIAGELADLPDDAPEPMRWVRAAAERGLYESRRAIAALTLPLDVSLVSAITEAVEEITRRAGTSVRFDLDETAVVAPAEREAILRIVREAVTNAVRHGDAKMIRVSLVDGAAGLTVRVDDDGVGIAPGAELRGFGLTSMRERVAAAGGLLDVATGEGRGTSVTATWRR